MAARAIALGSDLFGLGTADSQPKLPLKPTRLLVFGEFPRRTWWKLFLGSRFLSGKLAHQRET